MNMDKHPEPDPAQKIYQTHADQYISFSNNSDFSSNLQVSSHSRREQRPSILLYPAPPFPNFQTTEFF